MPNLLVLDLVGDQIEHPLPDDIALTKLGPWATSVEDPFTLAAPDFEPYPTPETVEDTCRRSLAAADTLFEHLTEIIPREINAGAGLPKRFWEVFLSYYVVHVAGIVEDLRTRCESISGNELVYGAPTNAVPEPPQDIGEYLKQCLSRGALRISLMDACVRAYLPCSQQRPVMYSEAGLAQQPLPSGGIGMSRLLRVGARQVAKVLADRRGASAIAWNSHMTSPDLIRLGHMGVAPFRPALRYSRIPRVKPDAPLRCRVFGNLPAPYSTVLQRTFPVLALEGLDLTLDAGRRIVKDQSGRTRQIYATGNIWSIHEPLRAAVSLLAAEGAQVISMQHGNGLYRASPWAHIEYRRSDVFLSWGWKDPSQTSGTRVVPLPSPYLSRLAARRELPKRWHALLLVFSEDRYPKWLYSPIFPDLAHDYFQRQRVLLEGLRPVPSVAVKLYPHEYGWRQNECISRQYPEFTTLSEGAFPDYARRARLCIVDYKGTGILELLAMGRPFLATWNRRWFRGIDSFERHLDALRRVGVFHENPAELMTTYVDVQARLDAWWQEPLRRGAVAAMADEFARISADALGELQQFMVEEQLASVVRGPISHSEHSA